MDSKGAVRGVIRDSSGRCFAVKMNEVFASVAEAIAMLEGCFVAQQENLTQVNVDSDSKLVITWLKESIDKASWKAFPVLTQVLDIDGSQDRGNEVADFVASHQVPEMRNSVWVIRLPSSFVRILNKDGRFTLPPVVVYFVCR